MIPASGQSQIADTLSPEDRELIAVAVGSEWASPGSVMMESTAPICKPGVTFCIAADLLDKSVFNWDFPDSTHLRQAFLERNQRTLDIGTLSLKLARLRRPEMERMFARGYLEWPILQQKYPGVRSLIQVSAPAYSADGLHALIYVVSYCNGRCGGGAVSLFERTSGRWNRSRNIVFFQG